MLCWTAVNSLRECTGAWVGYASPGLRRRSAEHNERKLKSIAPIAVVHARRIPHRSLGRLCLPRAAAAIPAIDLSFRDSSTPRATAARGTLRDAVARGHSACDRISHSMVCTRVSTPAYVRTAYSVLRCLHCVETNIASGTLLRCTTSGLRPPDVEHSACPVIVPSTLPRCAQSLK